MSDEKQDVDLSALHRAIRNETNSLFKALVESENEVARLERRIIALTSQCVSYQGVVFRLKRDLRNVNGSTLTDSEWFGLCRKIQDFAS